jgi:transcriptional regulator with XRE-family HTH domain
MLAISFMRLWNTVVVDAEVLGMRIRQARERRGISQDDLAVAVKKDQRAISEYENGKRKLAVTDLPLFASALNVPLLYFFEGDTELKDLDAVLLDAFHRLGSQSAREAIIDVVRVLSKALHPST